MRNIMARGDESLRNRDDDFDINDINDELIKISQRSCFVLYGVRSTTIKTKIY